MIKVGYLLSYDYDLIFTSINQIYEEADKIFIAIDVNRRTWSGNDYELPLSFFENIELLDYKNKIQIYEDNFYISELIPIECETRERNLLLKKMGRGWLIQLDVDEYVYDFKTLTNYLNKYWYLTLFPKFTPIVFKGKLITLFKQTEEGFLYIDNDEKFPFITNLNKYEFTRYNTKVRNHFVNVNVVHQSWARTDDEIQTKIKNWGHRDDFNTKNYFEFWKNISSSDYMNYNNIHPINPEVWNKLHFLPSKSIDEFINTYSIRNRQILINLSKMKIFKSMVKIIIGRE
ncbi:hypothetical protein BC952_3081 [Flavobacterium limicola]|uniref:Glycosyl transferase family 2 n=1 Tax=Flavobacterium limicola TaxID=180441 RepID=A0A495RQ47_9FLAO|nr:hypothetical protein [Flavobacterium limicola]RKS89652.1 hypothetical protein BC952_3081 [Flavobacterium limicola]